MTEINNLINQANSNLEDLKKLVISFEHSNDSKRIKIGVSDIDRCIQHGNHYLDAPSLYQPDNFRFHKGLVSLIDTIRDNDFGISLSKTEENEKLKLCNELIKLVEKIIVVNNKLNEGFTSSS